MPRAEFKLTRPNRLAGGKDASTLIYFLEHKVSLTVCDVLFSYSFFSGEEFFQFFVRGSVGSGGSLAV